MILIACYVASDFVCETMNLKSNQTEKCAFFSQGNVKNVSPSIIQGDFQTSIYLFSQGAPITDQVWIDSAIYGNYKIIEHLLWTQNQNYFSKPPPIQCLNEASRYGHIEIVKLLVQHGLYSMDAIIWATSRGHLQVVEYLYGQNLYDPDHTLTGSPWTALYIAKYNEYHNIEVFLRSVSEHTKLF